MSERLFLDERELQRLGFSEPNIRTLRALTAFINLQAQVAAAETAIDAAETDIAALETSVAGKQPLDATLTALAALSWSAGSQVPAFTAADTVSFRSVGAAAGTDILDRDAGDGRYAFSGSGVTSFNTRTGVVTLTLADVTGTGLAKGDIGLGNVDNTSDLNKPISTATQTALDAKLDDTQASAFGLTLLDDADAATARTTLGLGTAATQNTGTSGATIPLLNTNVTWSNACTYNAAGNASVSQLTFSGSTMNWINFSTIGVAAPAVGSRSAGTKIVLYQQTNASTALLDYAIGIEGNNIWISSPVGIKLYAAGTARATVTSAGIDVAGTYSVNGTQIATARITGWAAASGTATRTTFDTATVTTEQLAQRVKALIDDLRTHGLIGT